MLLLTFSGPHSTRVASLCPKLVLSGENTSDKDRSALRSIHQIDLDFLDDPIDHCFTNYLIKQLLRMPQPTWRASISLLLMF